MTYTVTAYEQDRRIIRSDIAFALTGFLLEQSDKHGGLTHAEWLAILHDAAGRIIDVAVRDDWAEGIEADSPQLSTEQGR